MVPAAGCFSRPDDIKSELYSPLTVYIALARPLYICTLKKCSSIICIDGVGSRLDWRYLKTFRIVNSVALNLNSNKLCRVAIADRSISSL